MHITGNWNQIPYLSEIHPKEVNCLAEAIYHESRGEPHEGQAAVVQVIFNRSKVEEFPDSWCKVVYQRGQFEWVRKTKKGHVHSKNNRAWAISYGTAVSFAVQHKLGMNFAPISVKDAIFFSRDGFSNPKLQFADKIGEHQFFNIISP